MRESEEMEDTEGRREENERGRGGETGMYHLILKIGGVYSLITSWVLEPVFMATIRVISICQSNYLYNHET